MTYTFRCRKTNLDFDTEYSFKEFDQIKEGSLIVECNVCKKCRPEMLMGGENVFVWFSDPKTVGSLADRNTNRRLHEINEAEEKKREEKKAAGKYVEPKEISIPWEKPQPKVDLKERKERRNEHLAKNKSRKRTTRINPSDIFKNK